MLSLPIQRILFFFFQGTIVYNPFVTQATKLSLAVMRSPNPKVYCFPFFSFMLAIGQTDIDYFSLDIQGFELDVLVTIPFQRLNIKVISVAYTHRRFTKQAYINFMKQKGYVLFAYLIKCNVFCQDFVFVKKGLL